jgi:hypothetical protein
VSIILQGKIHLKKIQKSDNTILKMAGTAAEPLPQVPVVNMLISEQPSLLVDEH